MEPRFPGSWPGALATKPHQFSLSSLAFELCLYLVEAHALHPTSFHWAICLCPTPVGSAVIWGIGNLAVWPESGRWRSGHFAGLRPAEMGP